VKEKFCSAAGSATGLAVTSSRLDVKVVILFNEVKLQLELLCGIHHTAVFRINQLACQKQLPPINSSAGLYLQFVYGASISYLFI